MVVVGAFGSTTASGSTAAATVVDDSAGSAPASVVGGAMGLPNSSRYVTR
jgi:hypothetical protein